MSEVFQYSNSLYHSWANDFLSGWIEGVHCHKFWVKIPLSKLFLFSYCKGCSAQFWFRFVLVAIGAKTSFNWMNGRRREIVELAIISERGTVILERGYHRCLLSLCESWRSSVVVPPPGVKWVESARKYHLHSVSEHWWVLKYSLP